MSWRNGRQPDRRRWKRARRAVLERDNWTCQCGCGRYGNEVDHIIPIDRMPVDADLCALDGLQTLARGCHIRKTALENTRPDPARDEWREYVAALERGASVV